MVDKQPSTETVDPCDAGAPLVDRLLAVMSRLRDPDRGCPWDLKQTFQSIAAYTIEEAYEVADAIARDDMIALREECGDLLFQVIYYQQMASEIGGFNFSDVVKSSVEKMIRRHPHIFGNEPAKLDAEAQKSQWEINKASERGRDAPTLAGVATALPALVRASKLQERAAQVGFSWTHTVGILQKLDEEIEELKYEIETNASADRLEDELGDVLFVAANLARHLGFDAEAALRRGNQKFEQRFSFIENRLKAEGRKPADATLAEMEALWQEAKKDHA